MKVSYTGGGPILSLWLNLKDPYFFYQFVSGMDGRERKWWGQFFR